METLIQDARYALRSLAKQRGFTAVAVLCLALGIGANTAIFSVVHTVLIQSLPYREPSQIVRLFEAGIFNGQTGLGSVSVPNYVDIRKDAGIFQSIAAYSAGSRDLQGNGPAVRIRVVRATADLFTVLGAAPMKGRVFAPGDDEEGRPGVAVISERFWQIGFGRDTSILGKTIHLSGTPYTIVGVMPASFDYPISAFHQDAWVPLTFP